GTAVANRSSAILAGSPGAELLQERDAAGVTHTVIVPPSWEDERTGPIVRDRAAPERRGESGRAARLYPWKPIRTALNGLKPLGRCPF
ncbi:MAG TPA: hypothetical protein VF175_04035, partial [Lacipirellula sp.]